MSKRGFIVDANLLLGLFLLFGADFAMAQAPRRTYPVADYRADPEAEASLSIEEDFESPDTYLDPDFRLAMDLPSPLLDRRFDSYNVVVVINQENLPSEPGQTARVYDREAGLRYFWRVSTARPGKETPNGYFRVQGFSSRHRSSIYNEAPMPWAVFFNGHIGTHGVLNEKIKLLGKRASSGCVRLEPSRARALFHLMGHSGSGLVDEIGPFGQPILSGSGLVRKVQGYRTLIVVKSQTWF